MTFIFNFDYLTIKLISLWRFKQCKFQNYMIYNNFDEEFKKMSSFIGLFYNLAEIFEMKG